MARTPKSTFPSRTSARIPASWLIVFGVAVALMAAGGPLTEGRKPLPEFEAPEPSSWVNSSPLTVAELRGDVLFVDVWTFG